jgi:hypothetical protein
MLNGRLQDINIVDPAYLKQYTHNLFYPAPAPKKTAAPAKATAPIPPASTVTVDVYNGGSAPGLAGGVSQALVSAGYKPGAVGNASGQPEPVKPGTQVFYGTGTAANAAKIARYFGATATAATSVPAGHVEILLGAYGDRLVQPGLWRYLGRCPFALGDVVRPGGERRAVGRLGHGQA